MKHLIKKLLKEALLDEDYAMHEEMDNLANEVLKQMYCSIVEKAIYRGGSISIYDKVFDVFINISKNKFNVLKKFIHEYDLTVNFMNTNKYNGVFRAKTLDSGNIELRVNEEQMVNDAYETILPEIEKGTARQNKAELCNDLYFKSFNNQVYSTLIHELQHAYDSYRSKNKYIEDKKSLDYYDKNNNQRTPEQLQNKYVKLQHEINARFSQAVREVMFFRHNFTENPNLPMRYKIMVDRNEALKDFKREIRHFDVLGPNAKKRVLNRFYKIYDEIEERVNADNAKLMNK